MKSIVVLLFLISGSFVRGQSIYYSYDNDGRIVSATLSNCTKYNYQYDSDGNRILLSKSQILFNPIIVENTCYAADQGSINLQSGQDYNYNWSNNQTSAFINNLASDTYTVTITDPTSNNTCIKSIQITQPLPFNVTTLTQNVSCYGYRNGKAAIDTASFSTIGYSFRWPDGSHGISTQNLADGNYSVSVTNDTSGCLQVIPFAISQPSSFITSVSSNDAGCHGSTDGFAAININGNLTDFVFRWSDSTNSNSHGNLSAGVQFVTVTDNTSGCVQVDTIIITSPVALNSSVSSQVQPCPNSYSGSIQLSATGGTSPYVYSIDSGLSFQSSNMFGGLTSGVYSLITRDAHYCLSSLNNVPLNALTVQNSLTITETGGLLHSPYTNPNIWYEAESNSEIGAGDTFFCQSGLSYYVKGIDNNGCLATSMLYHCNPTSVINYNDLTNFDVYPSPNTGEFIVEFSTDASKYELVISDVLGNTIATYHGLVTTANEKIPAALNNQAAGIYFVKLKTESNIFVKQIEIIR